MRGGAGKATDYSLQAARARRIASGKETVAALVVGRAGEKPAAPGAVCRGCRGKAADERGLWGRGGLGADKSQGPRRRQGAGAGRMANPGPARVAQCSARRSAGKQLREKSLMRAGHPQQTILDHQPPGRRRLVRVAMRHLAGEGTGVRQGGRYPFPCRALERHPLRRARHLHPRYFAKPGARGDCPSAK